MSAETIHRHRGHQLVACPPLVLVVQGTRTVVMGTPQQRLFFNFYEFFKTYLVSRSKSSGYYKYQQV